MYDNSNFNVIILSPGRTGSTLISKFFSQVTKLTPHARHHLDNILPMGPKQVLHSHTISDINLGNENTFYIISKRNMVETAFSSLIGRQVNKWEYYKNHSTNIINFKVLKEDFLCLYQTIDNFYKDLSNVVPKKSHIIDYSEFKNNFENLFDIFNINKQYYKFVDKNMIPIKTPGTYSDWIINYDEISSYAQTFDPNPPL
jgi:hypothetical protein